MGREGRDPSARGWGRVGAREGPSGGGGSGGNWVGWGLLGFVYGPDGLGPIGLNLV